MTVLASVEVEVTGKLTPLEQAFEKGRQEAKAFEKDATNAVNKAADATASASKKMADGNSHVAAAAALATKALSEMTEEQRKLGITEAGLILQQKRLAKETEVAAKALERQAEAAKKAEKDSGGLAKETEKAAETAKDLSAGAGASAKEMQRLGQHVGNAVGQIASGSPSIDVLASSARGAGSSLLAMGGTVAAVGGTIAAVTGVVVAGGVAWYQYDSAVQKAELSLYGIGKAAGLTTSDFMAMAEGAAEAANITDSAAREIASALIGAGVANQQVLDDLIVVTKDYAAVTGQEAADAARELGAAFADPIAGVETLEERLGALDSKTREHIVSLVEQNNLTGAQAELLKVLQGEVAGAADQVTGLAAAWRSVTTWATNAFEAMGKAIALESGGGTTGERIQFLEGRRNSGLGRFAAGVAGAFGAELPADQELRRLRATQESERATAAAAAAQAERNRVDREGREAVAALIPGDRQRATISAQIADIERARAAGTIDAATATRALAGAQRQLAAIDKREAGPQARRGRGNNRAEQLRREAEAMELNASSAIELAQAYLESGEAAVEAEARRQALTQATRRGTDVDAQARRQLALNVANVAVAGAKSVASMREETAARRAANDSVVEGTQSYREAAEWAQIDAAQRPLQNALIHAEGEAREALTQIIGEQYDAIRALNLEEARAQAIQQTEQLRDSNDILAKEIELIGKGNAERRIAITQLQTLQRIRAMGLDPSDPAAKGMIDESNRAADLDNQRELAEFMDRATKSTQDQVRAFREAGATMNMTWVEAERYRKEQELLNAATAAGLVLTDGQKTAIGQLADAYALASEEIRKLEEHQRAIQDATQFATDQFAGFFDEIIFGSGDAEDALRSLVRSAGQAMLQGFLSGQGPLAGILGTQQQPGQAGGGGLGAIFGGLFSGLFKAPVAHSGMPPGGQPASSRMVSPALFLGAPRLHDGLRPDEFPAILQKGEGVTPKGHRGGDGTTVYMTVQANDADSFRRSDRQIGRQLKRRLSI